MSSSAYDSYESNESSYQPREAPPPPPPAPPLPPPPLFSSIPQYPHAKSSGSPTSTTSAFNFTTTPSTTNSSLSSSRQSWMNGSDIEFEEELPTLGIDRGLGGLGQHMSDKEIKTQEVINELIHTEQKHVRNLKIMKHHFYLPIKVNMYLTKEELNVMFPNLEQVLDLHCNYSWDIIRRRKTRHFLMNYYFFIKANFNNKLKRLRKENPIVPIKQLINIILEQFKGERGEKFKTECARFCENQSQAMKLLQTKIKNNEKFNNFITVKKFFFVSICCAGLGI